MTVAIRSIAVASIVLIISFIAVVQWYGQEQSTDNQLLSQADDAVWPVQTNDSTNQFSVLIHKPIGPPTVQTGLMNPFGKPVSVSCSNCHSIREPVHGVRDASKLDEFHQGLTYVHGSLTCLACHNPDNYDELRLADQTSLPYAEVMTLCGQCHGPQFRDYTHGAHGGMTGYWDLSRGPRSRNNCIDCHDPHAPAFPMMRPTFKPKDRFLTGHSGDDGHD